MEVIEDVVLDEQQENNGVSGMEPLVKKKLKKKFLKKN